MTSENSILQLLEIIDNNFMISRRHSFGGFYSLSLKEFADQNLHLIPSNCTSAEFLKHLVARIQIEEIIEKYSSENENLRWAKSMPDMFNIESDFIQLNEYAKNYVRSNNLLNTFQDILDQARNIVIPKQEKKPTNQIGYIYLIKSELGYKIGKTKNIRQRSNLFSVKLPFDFEFEDYKKCLNYHEVEIELHEKFANKRINGEWFELSLSDVNEIKNFLSQIEI
ncbi:GIY-YIG nuclease family protein [Pontibacter sp. BT310]|uniref:GIY-YIG nuclease family protein n=1 Tax=Pontibacter populi TaxID=890055 RepID=A0ABS6XFM6_9BACT|nr:MULTISPECIES: GIY-YIG nuclease family protein [Pontibacter]MBJ6119136.1 GIY-YIG nuclease family protein [Pontibacter sp. BT310]MBR0571564.1 GIY-YIG nuclease family protein [Microvirga sp. STS03]MBW3365990.1 GIY-YIG nuclease family protein [Pontibacter populi]